LINVAEFGIHLGRGRGVAGIERHVREVEPLGLDASVELDGWRLAGEVAAAVEGLLSGGCPPRT
jgi:hypothetical protein